MMVYACVERKVFFRHQSGDSFVDIVPIGFRLKQNTLTYCSQLFERIEGLHEWIGCLFDHWLVGDQESQTQYRKALRRWLRAQIPQFRSEPFLDLTSCRVQGTKTAYQFVFVVDEDAASVSDRLEAFFERIASVYDPIPEWCRFLKDDLELKLPVDYFFQFSIASYCRFVSFGSKSRGMG